MKKVLLNFLLVLSVVVPLQAVETDSHDNRLYITVGESSDLTQVPITLYLENPTIAITAEEMYLTFPEGITVTLSKPETCCIGTHAITEGDTPRGYFVSVASEKLETFSSIEGAVCTLMCDFSALADGDRTITALGMFSVGIEGDVVTSYTTSSQDETFTKTGDTMTGIDEVKSDKSVLEIYNLQDIRLKEPQKGQVNIINGKNDIMIKRITAIITVLAMCVITTGFTPAGLTEDSTESYTLTADEKGNAYLYGTFVPGAT